MSGAQMEQPMQRFNLCEYDVVFLSYDEPNADYNFEVLKRRIPHVLRVHGVKGSDSAHKACARITSTDRIIIVDGDNVVHGDILNCCIELDDSVDAASTVFSWPSRNSINGLLYGNGGIKCWPRQAIFNMRTHENAEPGVETTQVDFCWQLRYLAIDQSFSSTVIHTTKQQAFRAGFREGVKMALHNGKKVNSLSELNHDNLNRLRTWLAVGLDIENGIWSILGAWLGCHRTQFTQWDYTQVRDFEFLNQFFIDNIHNMTEEDAMNKIKEMLPIINQQLEIPGPFGQLDSKFYKTFNNNPKRQTTLINCCQVYTGYDIVMITYDEKYADENYIKLIRRFPTARRIHGIKGIHNAHVEAAKIVGTPMFWVVDGDAIIDEHFYFDFMLEKSDDFVRVWRCKNPVNDLVYGYGGVKLLPRELTINMDMSKPDMTTSISKLFMPVQVLSNVTQFNVDEFSAWRSGFRECCKLSSKVIDRQKDAETIARLNIWCTAGADRPYGPAAIAGALAGRLYGEEHQGNVDALKKINDFEWLQEQFNATLVD
jgi:hypothetical protein